MVESKGQLWGRCGGVILFVSFPWPEQGSDECYHYSRLHNGLQSEISVIIFAHLWFVAQHDKVVTTDIGAGINEMR
jgi:hypothetical protein